VMRQTDGALFCRMENQHRWIAPTQLHGLVPFQGLHD